tara:strand:- start:3904 stop:4416 length:513 start_codon:yes stop_codon:yes gene_type:complete
MNDNEMPSGAGEILDVDPNHLAVVKKAMFGVINKKNGTAYSRRIETGHLRMSGKTGTAQVRRITETEREQGIIKNEDLPWEKRDHSLFVNYAPYDNPRVAVAVVVEHGGSGSSLAAPIARDITLFALTGKVPDPQHYPEDIRQDILNEQKEIMPRLIDWTKTKPVGQTKA